MFEEIHLIWHEVISEVRKLSHVEIDLKKLYHEMILQHKSFEKSLSYILSDKLSNPMFPNSFFQKIIENIYISNPSIIQCAIKDIYAVYYRDPVIKNYSSILLYLKGFHALQIYRVSHQLWKIGRNSLAIFLQHRSSMLFSVDIHPAANIGYGIMLDHATGIIIGETVLIENNVSILHAVTLGSTGKKIGKRHPTIREGVMIGAGAKILGDIEIGLRTKIGAGSVVLRSIPADVTAVGVPARIITKSVEKISIY